MIRLGFRHDLGPRCFASPASISRRSAAGSANDALGYRPCVYSLEKLGLPFAGDADADRDRAAWASFQDCGLAAHHFPLPFSPPRPTGGVFPIVMVSSGCERRQSSISASIGAVRARQPHLGQMGAVGVVACWTQKPRHAARQEDQRELHAR